MLKTFPYEELHFKKGHGAMRQNYHIFTPCSKLRIEVMVWGNTPWIKEFPVLQCRLRFSIFEHGRSS